MAGQSWKPKVHWSTKCWMKKSRPNQDLGLLIAKGCTDTQHGLMIIGLFDMLGGKQ